MSEDITATLTPAQQPDPVPGLLKDYDSFIGYASKLSGNYETARDLVQDAFVKLIERKDTLKQDNLSSWMYFSIHNAFISECRHNKAARKCEKKLQSYNQIVEEAVSAPEFEREEISNKITDAIVALPDEFRSIFTDCASGMKYNEVASKYQMPIGTVMSRLFRARQLLQEKLESHKVA